LHCANSKKVKSDKVVALPFIHERSDKLGHNHCFGKSKNAKKHRKLRRKKTFQKKTKMPRAYVRARKTGSDRRIAGSPDRRICTRARSVRVGVLSSISFRDFTTKKAGVVQT